MEKRNVAGVTELHIAVVEKDSNVVVSLHQDIGGAERFLLTYPNESDFEIVKLLDPVGYRHR